MDGDFMDEEVLLRRYALVGGPDDMIPAGRSRRSSVISPAVAEREEAMMSDGGALVEVKGLRIAFGDAVPVRNVSFTIPAHGRVALVGESGCGKSLTALSLWKDHPEVRLAYIFQNPMESLNPVMKIGAQIHEAAKGVSREEIVELLRRTGLEDPGRVYGAYPCRLSGGQCQRAMIAMALAAKPELLVADEPTTALDVTTQREVLELIDSLADETGMAVLLITHNLGLVAGRMDTVNVMFHGCPARRHSGYGAAA